MCIRILIIVLLPFYVTAQGPAIEWKTYITDLDPYLSLFGTDIFNSDAKGNIYIGGKTSFLQDDIPDEARDITLYKFTSDGAQVWRKQFGSFSEDYIRAIDFLPSGEIILSGASEICTGLFDTGCEGDLESWIICLSESGDIISKYVFSGSNRDLISELLVLENGNIIIGGYTNSTDGFFINNINEKKYFIACLNVDYKLEWIQYHDIGFTDIAEAPNGELFACGVIQYDEDDTESTDIWYGGIDGKTGEFIFTNIVSGNSTDYQSRLVVDDSHVYIGLASFSTDGLFFKQYGEQDFFLIKTDFDGDVQWVKNYGGRGRDSFSSISFDQSRENLFLGGEVFSNDGDIIDPLYLNDAWIIKVDKDDGEIIWSEVVDINMYSGRVIHITGVDGSIYIRTTALVEDVSIAVSIPALVKLKPEIDTTKLVNFSTNLFPNPIFLGQQILLRSDDLTNRFVNLTLFDNLGREVWSVEDFHFFRSEMQIDIDAELAPGIYYLNIIASNSQNSLPLVIIRE